MRKYKPLYDYLVAKREAGHTLWNTTFEEVEEVIGIPLPSSARRWAQFWENDNMHVQALAWMDAGWLSHNVNLAAGTVSFLCFPEKWER